MAASSSALKMEKVCSFCLSTISSNNYRCLESRNSRDEYTELLATFNVSPKGYICNLCSNKLNKLNKLSRVKEDLIREVKELPGVRQLQGSFYAPSQAPIPVVLPLKRELSPQGGATPDCKKPLLYPAPESRTVCAIRIAPYPTPPEMVDAATETTRPRKEFDVKVTVMYNGKERSKVIDDKAEQIAIKALLNNKGPDAVINHLSKCERYKSAIINRVSKICREETSALVTQPETLFKARSTNDLVNVDLNEQAESMKSKVPTLVAILTCVMGEKLKLVHLVVAVAVILYARSQLINMMQFIIGLVLDGFGLKKEGLKFVHDLGLAVSYKSIRRKRRDLANEQEGSILGVVHQLKQASSAVEVIIENSEELDMDV